jgi:hypothetical protein
MNKKTYTYEEIKEALKSPTPPTITFNKKDGEVRVMECTLVSDLIPTDKAPKGTGLKKTEENKETLSVFDINKKDWRAFKVALVTDIKYN